MHPATLILVEKDGRRKLGIQHSTFNIQHSTFNIQHSTFNIQHSTFNIQHSTFNIQQNALITHQDHYFLSSILPKEEVESTSADY
jgi:hypothetical protein